MIGRFLVFIRFSHTVFALPFALGAMLVAANGRPAPQLAGLVVLAMVFARTAAMTFNRLADWNIDQRNPRTADRHRLVPRWFAAVMLGVSSAAFLLTCRFINPLCFALSPVALFLVLFYSVTKRFTVFSQFFLGLALAVAPVGGWLAVTGRFALPPLVLAAGVLCWVAGFDMIYAAQDVEVDRREGLKSMVVWLGVPRALRWAQGLHAAMLAFLAMFGAAAGLGPVYFASLAVILAALLFEHHSAARLDVAAIQRAFFQSNAVVSAVFVGAVWLDRLLHGAA